MGSAAHAPVQDSFSHPRSKLFIACCVPVQEICSFVWLPAQFSIPGARARHASRMKDYPSCWGWGLMLPLWLLQGVLELLVVAGIPSTEFFWQPMSVSSSTTYEAHHTILLFSSFVPALSHDQHRINQA